MIFDPHYSIFFFFNDTATTEIYTLSLHDALPISNLQAKRLSFAGDAADAVQSGEAIFICVGTPPKENGEADLSAIDNVARLIATEAHSSKLVIEKSTVPAQTGQQLKRVLSVYRRDPSVEFRVASNPEFHGGVSAVNAEHALQ